MLPSEKFVDRELVHAAGFLDRNTAAAHGEDESRFAPHCPSVIQNREVRKEQYLRGVRDIEIVAHDRH